MLWSVRISFLSVIRSITILFTVKLIKKIDGGSFPDRKGHSRGLSFKRFLGISLAGFEAMARVPWPEEEGKLYYFLRAHVHHSMKNEYTLNVSVVMSKASGFVVKARCDCKSRALNRCAHVAAVLLALVDYTKANGHGVTIPSTSKPCVWNRGKKRAKDPQPLHEAKYKSRKLSDGRVYYWDPRPKEHRGEVTKQQRNNFNIDLQSACADANEQESMWETSLRTFHEDYKLSNERKTVLQEQVATLRKIFLPVVHVARLEVLVLLKYKELLIRATPQLGSEKGSIG